MDVTILNTNLDAVSIVDTYESFIWTDRYYACRMQKKRLPLVCRCPDLCRRVDYFLLWYTR